MSADGVESTRDRSVCGQFPEIPEHRRIAVETVPEASRTVREGGQDAWLNRVGALSVDELQHLAVELDSGVGRHHEVADR